MNSRVLQNFEVRFDKILDACLLLKYTNCDCDQEFLEDLVIVGLLAKLKTNIDLDDLDSKKKLGAAKAVAELRNRKNNIEEIGSKYR